jgi:hypothetical protein
MKHRRVVVPHHGGPKVLQVIEEDLPEPRAGEVRVKVEAAGVSAYDLMFRRSRLLPGTPKVPFTLGEDVVGIVDKLGEGVSGFELGERVAGGTFSLGVGGGYTEFLCMAASEWVPVPPGVDPAEAVCLVVNYVTAHVMLHRAADVQRGERILVQGAAGAWERPCSNSAGSPASRCTAQHRGTTTSSSGLSGGRPSTITTRISSSGYAISLGVAWTSSSIPSAGRSSSGVPIVPCAGAGGWSGSAWQRRRGRA